MSEDSRSSNPFRRKAPPVALPIDDDAPRGRDVLAQQPQAFDPSNPAISTHSETRVKPVKKVRVQSPHSSSLEEDSPSHMLHTPIPQYDGHHVRDDPFDNSQSDINGGLVDDHTTANSTSQQAPINPFQKTLATLERTDGEARTTLLSAQSSIGAGRASMDVEAFKRLLMTGNAGVASSTPIQVPGIISGLTNGSSTETSSTSRQSIFESIPENRPESLYTSHEVSENEDSRRRYAADSVTKPEKKKPAPPSSRHGKLIKLEFKDEDVSVTTPPAAPVQQEIMNLSANSSGSLNLQRSPTDLNKPLPPAPFRASQDSDRESIFDREAAGKTPEPPSPESVIKKKAAPPPPLTRRHSQLVADFKPSRLLTGRLSPNLEEGGLQSLGPIGIHTPPPPPPPRRPHANRNPSYQHPLTSPSLSIQEHERSFLGISPAPPPTRVPSIRQSTRPSSVSSMELSKRTPVAGPPPPPPRQRASSKTSVDVPIHSPTTGIFSGASSRRSMESNRSVSLPQLSSLELSEGSATAGANNILGDLAALQREVDALRGHYEKQTPP